MRSIVFALVFFVLLQTLSAQGQWTWVGGNKIENAKGIYGEKGVPSEGAFPGARSHSATWTTTTSFWMFGGYGYDSNSEGRLNDLWEFAPSQNQWIWQDGSNLFNQPGNYTNGYGEVGVPGARSASVSWVDPKENTLWLFGGSGYGSDSPNALLNDLWRYRKEEGWVWIVGNSTDEHGVYEGDVTYPGGRSYAMGWTDKEGGLWLFGGLGHDASLAYIGYLNDVWRFFNGSWEFVGGSDTNNVLAVYTGDNQTPGSTYGSQVWQFPNGTVRLFGGWINGNTSSNDFWEWQQPSHKWKWLSGSKGNNTAGRRGAKGKPNVGNILGSRYFGTTAIDSQGSLWLFGGVWFSSGSKRFNDLWKYSESDDWVWIAGSDQSNQPSNYDGPGEVYPGGRRAPAMWIDNNDTLWLFGGWELSTRHLNDLWTYSPTESSYPTDDNTISNASKDKSWISILVGAIVGVVLLIPTN